jgi:hypothetical protein
MTEFKAVIKHIDIHPANYTQEITFVIPPNEIIRIIEEVGVLNHPSEFKGILNLNAPFELGDIVKVDGNDVYKNGIPHYMYKI